MSDHPQICILSTRQNIDCGDGCGDPGGYYVDEMLLFHYAESSSWLLSIISPHRRYISFTGNTLTSELYYEKFLLLLATPHYDS